MRKALSLLTASALTALLLALTGPAASAGGTTYAFRLGTPNVAAVMVIDEHHQAGDTIRLTGSGTFDPTTGSASGGGSFVHLNADGTVHMRGTWQVTGLVSFEHFGGPTSGKQGGVLRLATRHLHADGTMCECGSTLMTITSAIAAPVGTIPGTTTGPFGSVVSGAPSFAKI